MPIELPTILFEDYFDGADPLANYDAAYLDPPVLRNLSFPANSHPTQSPHPALEIPGPLSNHSFSVRPGEGPGGENCLTYLPAISYCPACAIDDLLFVGLDDCGTPFGICDFGQLFVRWRTDTPTPGGWYHVRFWVKLAGSLPHFDGDDLSEPNWLGDPSWLGPGGWMQDVTMALSILMPKEAGHPGHYGPAGEPISYRPAVRLDLGRQVDLWWPTTARQMYYGNFITPGDDSLPLGWVCYELAVGEIDSSTGTGRVKLWGNDKLLVDEPLATDPFYGYPALGDPIGFAFGTGSNIGGGGGTPSVHYPFVGSLFYGSQFQERWPDRSYGLSVSFARIMAADGPIGCFTRGVPTEEEPTPDPDSDRCFQNDDYLTAHELAGECGRVICNTYGKTRESWETVGAGFPSAKSAWYTWVAPRTDRFIWRTRGSEVFNEVSVHRHTGALPPPVLASASDDAWDPDATTSSAVEVAVEEGVEYRIRVASASDGWTVLDFGPGLPIVQDDGWTINDSERETRERVFVAGTVSGMAVQDDQVAAASNGAGAQRTLDGVLWG